MNGFKLLLQVMGSILIMVSGKFSFELIGIGCLIGAGYLTTKQVIIKRIGRGQ